MWEKLSKTRSDSTVSGKLTGQLQVEEGRGRKVKVWMAHRGAALRPETGWAGDRGECEVEVRGHGSIWRKEQKLRLPTKPTEAVDLTFPILILSFKDRQSLGFQNQAPGICWRCPAVCQQVCKGHKETSCLSLQQSSTNFPARPDGRRLRLCGLDSFWYSSAPLL